MILLLLDNVPAHVSFLIDVHFNKSDLFVQ